MIETIASQANPPTIAIFTDEGAANSRKTPQIQNFPFFGFFNMADRLRATRADGEFI